LGLCRVSGLGSVERFWLVACLWRDVINGYSGWGFLSFWSFGFEVGSVGDLLVPCRLSDAALGWIEWWLVWASFGGVLVIGSRGWGWLNVVVY